MSYNALKSIEVINFVNILMCLLVSCSNGGGQVSPVRTMAFWKILHSFSSIVQFKMMWLIVCSAFSLQGHVEFGIILNLWRYDLVNPWPVVCVSAVYLTLRVSHAGDVLFRLPVTQCALCTACTSYWTDRVLLVRLFFPFFSFSCYVNKNNAIRHFTRTVSTHHDTHT